MEHTRTLLLGGLAVILASCSSMGGPNQTGGTLIGGVAGGVIGSKIAGGGMIGPIVGTLAGAIGGAEIGKRMDHNS
jgi:uncharacterized protein YcfJ